MSCACCPHTYLTMRILSRSQVAGCCTYWISHVGVWGNKMVSVQVAATLFAVRPLDPLFHFPLNQLVGISYVASSLTLLALAVSLPFSSRSYHHSVLCPLVSWNEKCVPIISDAQVAASPNCHLTLELCTGGRSQKGAPQDKVPQAESGDDGQLSCSAGSARCALRPADPCGRHPDCSPGWAHRCAAPCSLQPAPLFLSCWNMEFFGAYRSRHMWFTCSWDPVLLLLHD